MAAPSLCGLEKKKTEEQGRECERAMRRAREGVMEEEGRARGCY